MAGAIYLCGGDFTLRPDTESDCPDRDRHSPQPSGYVDRSEWAQAMLAHGARVRQCPTCGLYAMWTVPTRTMPKAYRAAPREATEGLRAKGTTP